MDTANHGRIGILGSIFVAQRSLESLEFLLKGRPGWPWMAREV